MNTIFNLGDFAWTVDTDENVEFLVGYGLKPSSVMLGKRMLPASVIVVTVAIAHALLMTSVELIIIHIKFSFQGARYTVPIFLFYHRLLKKSIVEGGGDFLTRRVVI